MTLGGRAIALFPALVVAGAGVLLLRGLVERSAAFILLAVASLYLVPLLAFRLHQFVFPLRPGPRSLDAPRYEPWWGSHQCQLLFVAVPVLENVLRLIPGLFSVWLRAWGSDVGRGVHWTPVLRLGDRSLLSIGDHVIFGHDVGVSSHIIKPTRKRLLLYVDPIVIGDGVFLGAGVVLGPGAHVDPGTSVPAGTIVPPRQHYPQRSTTAQAS